MTVLVETRRLVHEYTIRGGVLGAAHPLRAVNDVSLKIEGGTTYGLVGESGSGKSTLSRLLLAMEKPTRGQVLFRGNDLVALRGKDLRRFRRQAQAIFQDPYGSLPAHMKIRSILEEPFKIHGIPPDQRHSPAELLSEVSLGRRYLDQYPGQLSGGQRQRVVIARALALRPSFVVCDEPVSALDVSVQAGVLSLLAELQEAHQLTYLFVSHDLAVVRAVSDTIGVMYQGEIVESGPRDAVYLSGRHPYTKALVTAIPTLSSNRPGAQPIRIKSARDTDDGACTAREFCEHATHRCAEAKPQLTAVDGDHFVACHYAADLPTLAL